MMLALSACDPSLVVVVKHASALTTVPAVHTSAMRKAKGAEK